VARHENEISETTDVASRPEFADLKATKVIDGTTLTGWFTEDFTFAQLRTLRAVERLPEERPDNTAFNGLYQVPTLDEVLDFARHSRTCDGRKVGVYPETKHPTYFDSQGLSLEEPLLRDLEANGFDERRSPVFIQSFETGNLRELNTKTPVRLAQLADCDGAPYDLVAAGDPREYADLLTRKGLREIATYADGVGLCKEWVIPWAADDSLGEPTSVVADAHRFGLDVHAWTFRRENQFMPTDFRSSADPTETGDLVAEIRTYLAAGIDGFFTDNPDLGVAAAD
jgi:glycerophosphoryl diester phosphodiesterase